MIEDELDGTRVNGFLFDFKIPKDMPKPLFNPSMEWLTKHNEELEQEQLKLKKLKKIRCDGVTKKGRLCTQLLGKIDGNYEIKCVKCGKIHTNLSNKQIP